MGAIKYTDASGDETSGSLPGPGRATWQLGVVVLPLLLALVPWLVSSQSNDASGAETFEIDGDPVTRLVSTVSGSGVLYAVGEDGLYRGDAAGATWERVGDEPPAGAIVAADDSDMLLAGDAPSCGRGDGGLPLSRSLDGGATWEEVAGVADIRPLAVWGDDELALGGSCEGLQLSVDSGDSWSLVEGLTLGQSVTAFGVVADQEERIVLVGTTGEGGTSQLYEVNVSEPTAPEVSAPLKDYYGLGAVAGTGDQRVLAAADGVWISIDEGNEWTLRTEGLDDVILSVDPLRESIPAEEAERGFGLTALALDPENANQLALGAIEGLYVSDTAGAEWSRVDGVDGEVQGLVISDIGGLVLVQTEDGVFSVRPWDT